MGSGKPIWLTDISYSEEEEKQTNNEDDIRDQRAEDTLPVYGTRTKANAVNDACADRPHQQKTMPDFKLTGFGRET